LYSLFYILFHVQPYAPKHCFNFSLMWYFLKIFSAKRGHLKLFIRSQEFFRTLQRHYSNACIDANKQAAINLYVLLSIHVHFAEPIVSIKYWLNIEFVFYIYFRFLGYFQPEQGNPALWELESSSEEHNNEPLDHTG
jgi:hypothetical protein